MKGKITSNGTLQIDRGVNSTRWKDAFCPFPTDDKLRCGDWCPHFDVNVDVFTAWIHLCHGKIIKVQREHFTDERP